MVSAWPDDSMQKKRSQPRGKATLGASWLMAFAVPLVAGAALGLTLGRPVSAQLPTLPEDESQPGQPASDVQIITPPAGTPRPISIPVEDEPAAVDDGAVPTVERSNQRPTLEDLDPRILTGPGPDADDRIFQAYRLGPGDSIFVSVQRFPDLAFQATLDQQGNVIVPIEGAVPLEGLTLNQAENRLRAVYNQYVVLSEVRSVGLGDSLRGIPYPVAENELNARIPAGYQILRTQNPGRYGAPDVTITLTAQRGVEVLMLGEIERPGLYPLPIPRVTAALLAAGGVSSEADLRAVRIQRQLTGPGGSRVVEKTVDLYTPLREGVPLEATQLEDGDVLIIPRLDPGEVYDYDVNLVSRSTLAQPQIIVRVLDYPTGVLRGVAVPNGSTFVDAVAGNTLQQGGGIGVSLNEANLRSVGLVRFDPEQGKPVVLKLNVKEAVYGDPTQNPPLRNNDVIVVGRNLLNRITYAIDVATRPFRDVLGFLLFFENISDLGF